MTRSQSQDTNVGTAAAAADLKSKSSQSDNSLDSAPKSKSLRPTTIKEASGTIEEDVCSTDSSLMDEETKKKKKKLFGFSKKSKGKGD